MLESVLGIHKKPDPGYNYNLMLNQTNKKIA